MTKPNFRSKFEEWIHSVAVKYKNKLQFEPHYLKYTIHSKYLPDFLLPNGIYVEAKGKFDAGMRKKMLAVKVCNPGLDIRFVFQNAQNKLRKGAKQRYWEWAEQHGFKWAEGTIPPSWWKEKKNNDG